MKSSRLGVGSLIRAWPPRASIAVSGDLRLLFIKQLPAPIHPINEPRLPKRHYTEAEATSLVVQGREAGLDYFFQRYYTPLLYFARSLTVDESAAEDMVAESFVKLWQHRTTLTQPSSIKPYLYKTVRHAAIDYLRRQKRQKIHQQEVIYLNVMAEETILAKRIETETYDQLFQLLQGLPPKCGRVLRMAYMEGKSNAQIAQELNLSINTVRNQKAQALSILRKKLPMFLLLLRIFLGL